MLIRSASASRVRVALLVLSVLLRFLIIVLSGARGVALLNVNVVSLRVSILILCCGSLRLVLNFIVEGLYRRGIFFAGVVVIFVWLDVLVLVLLLRSIGTMKREHVIVLASAYVIK